MVLSLSTQGYQSILLSVSMHQNEPVKQSDMHSFSFTPSSSSVSVSLALPPFQNCFLLSLVLLSPPLSLVTPVSFCPHLSSPPSPFPSFLPPSIPLSISPCQKRLHESISNHIQKTGSNKKTLSMAI